MKKVLVLAVAVMATMLSAKAEVEFAYEAGAELVSAYLWRGQYNGGLSLQPEGLVGFDALDGAIEFRGGVWANIGASDWKFKKDLPTYLDPESGDEIDPNTRFMPEVDFMASVKAYGASIGYNAYYYCNDGSDHTSELWVGYNFDHFFGVGAYINWYTMIAGGGDVNSVTGRPDFSSYIELGYDYTFEDLGLTLGAQVGMSPWQSENIYYNDKFAVVNIALNIHKEWEVGPCTLDLFATGSLNPNGLDKENVYINGSGDEKLYCQKLNGSIGLGVWF